MIRITEIYIKLLSEDEPDRLLAFCSITLEGMFVVRDLKIIQGRDRILVAMPARKLTDRCPYPDCGAKNVLQAKFCQQCGCQLNPERAERRAAGRSKLYADIAHPISTEARIALEGLIIGAYERERQLSTQPGYVCHYDTHLPRRSACCQDSAGPVFTLALATS